MRKERLLKEIEAVLDEGKKEIYEGNIKGCLILIRNGKPTEIEVW